MPRISRCLSSPPPFSLSESDPSSKVSCSVLSASSAIGSSDESKCRDAMEEALDLKEGGGEEGMVCRSWGLIGVIGVSS